MPGAGEAASEVYYYLFVFLAVLKTFSSWFRAKTNPGGLRIDDDPILGILGNSPASV